MTAHSLHLDHDGPTLAALLGRAVPCDGLLLRDGAPSDVLACRVEANPLAPEGWAFDRELPGSRLLSWSGTLADQPFGRDWRTWSQGREALDRFCERVRPAFEREEWTLAFRPHARHVLSDARSCRDFLARHSGGPFELAFDPSSMLEASMLKAIDEHLERLFETLGPLAAMVILSDVAITARDDDAPGDTSSIDGDPELASTLHRCPAGEGDLALATLCRLLRAHVPATTPVVVRGEDAGAWRALLDLDDSARTPSPPAGNAR